ncbi:MAG: hypothetical protein SGJ09_16385 [Phycisphaerae bacterium]|nr:hypothetical protein [Phycisphaerae bacterium]
MSWVVASGASARTAQELARHSTPTLTIGRYSHTRMSEMTAALGGVPGLAPTSVVQLAGGPPTSAQTSVATSAVAAPDDANAVEPVRVDDDPNTINKPPNSSRRKALGGMVCHHATLRGNAPLADRS